MIFEIGYFIEEVSQGKGYITEAVHRAIEFLFKELEAMKLEIHTKGTNARSIGVAERCGFTKEAHLRERGRTNEGDVVDILIFGLLRSVAERCGFTKEAHLRERGRTNEGDVVDILIFGLLRSEFLKGE
jgi:RimJ/RimL family protein N-acetyltransferase